MINEMQLQLVIQGFMSAFFVPSPFIVSQWFYVSAITEHFSTAITSV